MVIDFAQAYSFLDQGETQQRPLVGISACLCGDPVRYDAQNKGLPELIRLLERQMDLMRICPEVAIGMSVPRPPIQLVRESNLISARGIENPQQDVTTLLQNYALSITDRYSPTNNKQQVLCGFILKSRSPSCGVGSTPVHENKQPVDIGNGIFSEHIQQLLPWLPIEEEGALQQPIQRLHFFRRTRLTQLFWQITSQRGLASFHQQASPLIATLPTATQSALNEQSCYAETEPQRYLSRLMQAVKTQQS